MAHIPEPLSRGVNFNFCCDSAPKSLSRSVPGSTFVEPPDDQLGLIPPIPTVSKVLYQEIDNLCTALGSLEAKMQSRLAPIMRQADPDSGNDGGCPITDFAPLFNGVFLGLMAAQRIVSRIDESFNFIDDL